jgi:hypothetical protein
VSPMLVFNQATALSATYLLAISMCVQPLATIDELSKKTLAIGRSPSAKPNVFFAGCLPSSFESAMDTDWRTHSGRVLWDRMRRLLTR